MMNRHLPSIHPYKLLALFLVCAMAMTGCQTGKSKSPIVRPSAEVKPHAPIPAHAADGKPSGIKWSEWSSDVFRRASSSDKLVFLDISATWCHWCEVMDETAYSDPAVIAFVNDNFIPVYVDADLRPDIDDRYNQGGWPSVAVLNSDARVLAGGTTMTASELMKFLKDTRDAYFENRERVETKLDDSAEAIAIAREEMEKSRSEKPLGPEMPVRVLRSVNMFVDPTFGGYGGPEKFPYPSVMEFALALYPKVKDNEEYSPARAIELTLDGMAAGLYDKVEGGMFRYATTQDWGNPHYEKLLETNGDLLEVYMWAYRELGRARYRDIAEGIAAYMESTLKAGGTGAFYNSQKADEQYYLRPYEQRMISGGPDVDGTVYADSNGHAALGFLEAYRATGDGKYLSTATGILDYIISDMYAADSGVTHTPGGSRDVLHLSDQVYPALAASKAYQATGNKVYLGFAMNVADSMVKKFWDPDTSGFHDVWYASGVQGLLSDLKKPQEDNAKAALLLLDLYYLTGETVYKQTARRTLAPFSTEYEKYSFWAAPFAMGVARCTETTYKFMVIGPPDEPGTMELIRKAYLYSDPDRVVLPLDPVADASRIQKEGYEYDGAPAIFVCSDHACFPPVRPGGSMDKTAEFIKRARDMEAGRQ